MLGGYDARAAACRRLSVHWRHQKGENDGHGLTRGRAPERGESPNRAQLGSQGSVSGTFLCLYLIPRSPVQNPFSSEKGRLASTGIHQC